MGPTTWLAAATVAMPPTRLRAPRPAANRARWRTPATVVATPASTTATVAVTAPTTWAGVPPSHELMTSDGPSTRTPLTATTDRRADPSDWVG